MSAIGAITAVAMSAPRPAVRGASSSASIAGRLSTGDTISDTVTRAFAMNPTRGLAAAQDMVSASISYNPALGVNQPHVPGTTLDIAVGNSMTTMSADQISGLSNPDFLAASQSSLAAVLTGGGGPEHMAQSINDLLKPDASGRDTWQVRIDSIAERTNELYMRLKANPTDSSILGELQILSDQIAMLHRDREKLELARKLIMSLMLGVVPLGLINRMKELGMGGVVAALIEQGVGSGKGASKAMIRDLQVVAQMGIDVHVVKEEHTDEAIGERDGKLAAQAGIAADGRVVDPWGRTIGTSSGMPGDELGSALRTRAAIFNLGSSIK